LGLTLRFDRRHGSFVAKHENAIRGVLSCFDRVLFRGYVP